MTDSDNTSDNHLYNTEQRRRGMATRARTREDTSGNNGSLGLGGGSLSAVIPGSNEAPRPLARSLDPPKPHILAAATSSTVTQNKLKGVPALQYYQTLFVLCY